MILIIGAGLSGLLTGYRLKKAGIPFKILEARNRIGGRIHTVYGSNKTPIEMGATWFNRQHKQLIALLEELNLGYFEQYSDRTIFYQQSAQLPVQKVQIPNQSASYRIYGGTSNLINHLFEKLDKNDVLLNQSVKQIKIHNNTVQVMANESFEGTMAILAIPPKLWANKILFEPSLPSGLMNIAQKTHTWMEDSIKIGLSYHDPFWENNNSPGTLFSNSGPITELYDHCNAERSSYALCGFMNSSLKTRTYSERRESALKQIVTIFGKKAGEFLAYNECIWSEEGNTFEVSNEFLYPHQNNGNPIFNDSFFDHKLLISCSESASEFPGYMEGAVYSANVTAEKITKAIERLS